MSKVDLEPAKEALKVFQKKLDEHQKLYQSISVPFVPRVSNDVSIEHILAQKDDAYSWIFGTPRYYSFLQGPKATPMNKYYFKPAARFYQEWRDLERDVIYRGQIIPHPDKALLGDYLLYLSAEISEMHEDKAVWLKSLDSFCAYLRAVMPYELQGNLEVIFPFKMGIQRTTLIRNRKDTEQKMVVNHRYIMRKIEDTVYPIDVIAAAEILQNLFKLVLEGRSNIQRSAAGALGFAWLCHAYAFARMMTQEQILFGSLVGALKDSYSFHSGAYFKPECSVQVLTLFGLQEVPISRTVYDYLKALPRGVDQDSSEIFSMPWESILRTLHRAVKMSTKANGLGKITFLTFMSASHEFFGHRAKRHNPLSINT